MPFLTATLKAVLCEEFDRLQLKEIYHIESKIIRVQSLNKCCDKHGMDLKRLFFFLEGIAERTLSFRVTKGEEVVSRRQLT